MSLLKYFNKPEKSSTSNLSPVCESMKSNLPNNISANELEKIHESLKVVQGGGKKKRTVYADKNKQETSKYTAVCGVTAAIRKFQQRFQHLTESTVRPWVKSYKKSIQKQKKMGVSSVEPKIGKSRGRPLILDEALDLKSRSMLVKLQLAGAGINIHVVSGVLNGLIRANPERFGKYMEFKVTRPWAQSLYQRMNFHVMQSLRQDQ